MGTERMSVEEVRAHAAAGNFNKKGRLVIPAPLSKPKSNKYGAVRQEDPEGGKSFPSTLEAKVAKMLRDKVRAGEITSVGRQVLVMLGDDIKWSIDFLVVHNDGSIEYVEAKGKDTPDFILKEKLFREKFPSVKLTILRAEDLRKKRKG